MSAAFRDPGFSRRILVKFSSSILEVSLKCMKSGRETNATLYPAETQALYEDVLALKLKLAEGFSEKSNEATSAPRFIKF